MENTCIQNHNNSKSHNGDNEEPFSNTGKPKPAGIYYVKGGEVISKGTADWCYLHRNRYAMELQNAGHGRGRILYVFDLKDNLQCLLRMPNPWTAKDQILFPIAEALLELGVSKQCHLKENRPPCKSPSETKMEETTGESDTTVKSNTPNPESRTAVRMGLVPSQRKIFNQLRAYAKAYFAKVQVDSFIQPRLTPLVAGPSGSGKSFLVKKLAKDMGLTYLRLTLGDWTIQNARNNYSTIRSIQDAVVQNKNRGVCIHIDELDKLNSNLFSDSSYFTAAMNEIFSVLDRDVSHCSSDKGNGWTDKASKALREKTFIVCSGTWHKLTNSKLNDRRPLGFGDRQEHNPGIDWSKTIRDAQIIPHELINRVAPEFLVINKMTAEDYRSAVESAGLNKILGITPDYKKMEEEGLNMRALEALVTHTVLRKARFGSVLSC